MAKSYEGCNANLNGVMGVFHNTDVYLQTIDQSMCTPTCPCFFTNTTAFTGNTTVAPYYNLWTKTNAPSGAVAFQNCTGDLQTFAFKEAVRRDPNFDRDSTFSPVKYAEYMNNVEREFGCSGWCSTQYFNPNYNQNVFMAKYLFSDINRGPPNRFGCFDELMDWLPGYLQAFGAMTMVLVGAQIAMFALAICQIWARESDHEKQIPHHHDDNRQI